MAHVLLLVDPQTPQDRRAYADLAGRLEQHGHRVTTLLTSGEATPAPGTTWHRAVEASDAALVPFDRAPPETRIAWILGLCRALRRPVLGLRADPRPAALPAFLERELAHVMAVPDWASPEVDAEIQKFLAGVRVFAGALVRDSVPRILKDEGRELRFRQADPQHYPHVLKRKLVETVQRLEDADFGLEQEEIADILELLETLINLRQYDRDSLKSIKEGKWRKRGGFQKGYLLDEEPALQSR